MAWDLFHAECLDLTLSELAEHLVRPQVPHLHELVCAHGHTDICRLELIVVVRMLAPVHDKCDSVAAADSRRINLRFAPEGVPVAATKEARCLRRLRVLIDRDQILVHQNVKRSLRRDG